MTDAIFSKNAFLRKMGPKKVIREGKNADGEQNQPLILQRKDTTPLRRRSSYGVTLSYHDLCTRQRDSAPHGASKRTKKEQEPSVKRRRILRKKVLKKEYVLDERQDDFKKKSPTYGRRIMSDGGRCWYGVDTVFGRCWYGVGVDYQRIRGVFVHQYSHNQVVMWCF